MLRLVDLAVGYSGSRGSAAVTVQSGISAELPAGELVCLLGPNGAGKSTLIQTLAGMLRPLAGRVLLEGADLHGLQAQARACRLSVVLTERVTAGLMPVYELVALGRHPHSTWSGRLNRADHLAIVRALEITGIRAFAKRPVGELSDGERQKVMVARALAQETPLMILDEITAFLDLPRRVEMMSLLRRLAHNENRAILLSTHDLDLALRSADRVWLLSRGTPFTDGAPEDLVLNGAFEHVFRSEGLEFDRASGGFHLQQAPLDSVRITASGDLRVWTARAVERAGFRVALNGEPASAEVEVVLEPHGPVWRVAGGAAVLGSFTSIRALVDGLRGKLGAAHAAAKPLAPGIRPSTSFPWPPSIDKG
jgi:iron complex transport system ATP-binding protein